MPDVICAAATEWPDPPEPTADPAPREPMANPARPAMKVRLAPRVPRANPAPMAPLGGVAPQVLKARLARKGPKEKKAGPRIANVLGRRLTGRVDLAGGLADG